ncbi:MAG TPA: hypothetical protein VGB54_11055 [Allosphingosinicella sp.]|jgi:hypothetical protein
MGVRYPDRIPPALAEVLGMPPHLLHPWWVALREVGVEVPRRYEGEVAAALHFLIPFAVNHPENWWQSAIAELQRLQRGGDFQLFVLEAKPAPAEAGAEPPKSSTPAPEAGGPGQPRRQDAATSAAPEDGAAGADPTSTGD